MRSFDPQHGPVGRRGAEGDRDGPEHPSPTETEAHGLARQFVRWFARGVEVMRSELTVGVSSDDTSAMRIARWFGLGMLLVLSVGSVSCVAHLTPEQSAVEVKGLRAEKVAFAVVDERDNIPFMLYPKRYIGSTRAAYGIPQHLVGLKPLAEQVALQLEAGLRKNGATVTKVVPESSETLRSEVEAAGVKENVLVVRLKDCWIDFANPMFGRESIVYFDATAEVRDRQWRAVATESRTVERDFQADAQDSFPNLAIRQFQPELQELVNRPSIRNALAR